MAKNLEQRVQELEKIVEKLMGKKVFKINAGIGERFELLGLNWIVLDVTEQGYMCIADRLKDYMQFDKSCNDWKQSSLRKYLNQDFYKQLSEEVGECNVVLFRRDLLSLDGQTEYGVCEDKISLISVDEYRKYRKHIPNTKDYSWWTLTADSTKCNGDTSWVRYVSSSGDFDSRGCGSSNGVRPVCIFSSELFESEG